MIESEDFTFLCSNCEAPLAEFLKRPGESEPQKIKALCPHCGDASFTKEIFSQFYIGATEYTAIDSLEENDGVLVIKTTRGKEHA